MNMGNNSLFDVLGLPKSADAAFEIVEGTIRGATQVIERGAKDFGVAVVETGKAVSGRGLDMKGSLVGFQEGKAKSPELMEQEKAVRDKRMFYTNITEQRQNIQRFAHERALDEAARLEVAGMTTVEKNEALHFNWDYSEQNISHPYHLHALREKSKEQLRAMGQQKKNTPIPSPAKQPNALEAIFEGGSGALGGKTANLSATGGNVG